MEGFIEDFTKWRYFFLSVLLFNNLLTLRYYKLN